MVRRLILPVLSILILVIVAGPAWADGGDVLLSSLPGPDYAPAVAYNSGPAQEFLVVWYHQDGIYAQRYNWQGLPQGQNFVVCSGGDAPMNPALAYALSSDAYLVVWQAWSGQDHDLFGQMVDAEGTLLDVPGTPEDESDPEVYFTVYEGEGDQAFPDVAFDGTNFLVVWGDGYVDADGIYGRLFQADGTPASQPHPIVAGDGQLRRSPALAYNPTADEYLVVYQHGEGAGLDIYGRRLLPDGTMPGDEYPIMDAESTQQEPDLATAAWGAYVVVWQDYRNLGQADIYGRLVLAGADDSFDGAEFPICLDNEPQFSPGIAQAPSSGQFLVTWSDNRLEQVSARDIYGQRLRADANLLGENFALATANGDQDDPVVAASQSPDIYLVAWTDERTGTLDIYGQRVAWTGSLLWYNLAVSAQLDLQTWPAVAYNSREDQFLAVWQDNASGQGSIYGQRLSGRGDPLEEPWAIESDPNNNGVPTAIYISSTNHYAVLWNDHDDDLIEGRLVQPAGTGTVFFTLPDSVGGIYPRAAYDAVNDRFLVVWEADGDIWNCAMCANGALCGQANQLTADETKQSFPDLAFDPANERFLVVWQDVEVVGGNQVSGNVVDALGSPLAEPFQIAGGDGLLRVSPRVAYNPDDSEYLVAYAVNEDFTSDIRGRRLTSGGGLIGEEIAISEHVDEVVQDWPNVAYIAPIQRYGVAWADGRDGVTEDDIYGRWLSAEGTPIGPDRPVFRYYGVQTMPALAYSPDGSRSIVAWADYRRELSGADVCARSGVIDATPPVARFTASPTVAEWGTTFTFDAWPSSDNLTPREALQARWDWTSDGSWDTALSTDKLVTMTVWLPGTYTITVEVWDMAYLTGTVAHTIAVVSPTANTSPTAALTITPLFAVAGTEFAFDASGSTDAETPDEVYVRWDWEDDGEWDTGVRPQLTATHTFTEAGLHSVRLWVRDLEGLTDDVVGSLLVLPGPAVTLTIAPREVRLGPWEQVLFRATAWDVYGNEMGNPAVAWSVADGAAGTISSTGWFTAGVMMGHYPGAVVATLGPLSDWASVTIVYPYQIYLPLVYSH